MHTPAAADGWGADDDDDLLEGAGGGYADDWGADDGANDDGGIHPPARDETAAFGATLAPRFAQDFVDAVAAANPAAATSASKHVAFISCRRIARESA